MKRKHCRNCTVKTDMSILKYSSVKKLILSFLILLLPLSMFAQGKSHAFDVNERLGRGVNFGNIFEAPSENEWGNSWDASYIKIIADLGFSHVRLPIRWEVPSRTMTEMPYTISADFLERIKGIVDEALKNKLHIIINMHHHESLYNNPSGQKARFLSQWQQISDYFKAYPDSLLFEIMNEPQKELSNANVWNQFFADALVEVRKTNPERCVLVCSSNWGGINGLNTIELPDDENLILTVHYYNPFNFTHQGADWSDMVNVSGIKWLDTELEREVVRQEFRTVRQYSEKNNIPVHVGEFGAYSKADMDSRARWTTFVSRFFEEQGFSWAYWEFNAGFGFYNSDTKTFVQPLVDALLNNQLPEPTPVNTTVVYESDFKNSGTSGWYFQATNGAVGSTALRNDILDINISAVGSESWHIQLTKSNTPVEEGQQYRLSLLASATKDCQITSYIGRSSDPWDAYSNYQSLSLSGKEELYSYTFTMKSPSDPNARICFDLGTALPATTISLRNIKLEKVEVNTVANEAFSQLQEDNDITITGGKGIVSIQSATGKRVYIYNAQGETIVNKTLLSDNEEIPVHRGIIIVKIDDLKAQKVLVR